MLIVWMFWCVSYQFAVLPLVLSEFQCDQALCTLSQKAGSFLVTLVGECQIMTLLCTMLKFTLNKENLLLQVMLLFFIVSSRTAQHE